ncbi:CD82 antigen-like isoform X2 [Saccostrea echinata]|uniref:CD82 antigen-like isoform X1 n=1 Tax=Saccostrea echinata TaxID=191078 RepID=UPI002A81C605|nr:CD82 antigen-like isoform X1 [Saccostrea echinata]XP_061182812.1 CD82 antigen-like isoform X2 [Saccostrea echinata]
MAGCCNTIARGLLILFNIIFWLSGAALLGLGIWFKVDKNVNSYFDVVDVDTEDPYFDYAVYVLIGFGAFIFLVGFCGCCGAIRESKCLLGFYVFFLIIIIGGEIAAGALGFIYKDKVESKVEDLLMETMSKYRTSKNIRNAWDFVQIELECCGSNEPDNWNKFNITYNAELQPFPASCCVLRDKDKAIDNLDSALPRDATECFNKTQNYYQSKGCVTGLKDLIAKYNWIIFGVAIGIAALEVVGIILAICVCREISKD